MNFNAIAFLIMLNSRSSKIATTFLAHNFFSASADCSIDRNQLNMIYLVRNYHYNIYRIYKRQEIAYKNMQQNLWFVAAFLEQGE